VRAQPRRRSVITRDRSEPPVRSRRQFHYSSNADLRRYELPAEILRYFGVRSVRLLSNNPDKFQALERAGIQLAERVPRLVPPSSLTEEYLRTKKKMGHMLEGF